MCGMSGLRIGLYGRFGRGGNNVSTNSSSIMVCRSPAPVVPGLALRWNWRRESEARSRGNQAKRRRAAIRNELFPLPHAADEHIAANDRDDPYAHAYASPPFS